MIRTIFIYLTVALGSVGAVVFCAGAADVVSEALPLQLQQIADRNQCGSYARYFHRDGMVLPPYLYGYLPGSPEQSAAFWCFTSAPDKFILLFYREGRSKERDRCPDAVSWNVFPGGLSLSSERHILLKDFHYIDDGKSGPARKFTAYPPLRDYYDGTEALFYCNEGRWMVRLRE